MGERNRKNFHVVGTHTHCQQKEADGTKHSPIRNLDATQGPAFGVTIK